MSGRLAEVRDLVVSAAAAITAITAWRGLHTWQRELRGRTEYDLARRLAIATYQFRDAVLWVRSSGIPGWEYPAGSEPGDVGALRAVYQRRWGAADRAIKTIEMEGLEAEAVWGEEVRAPLDALNRCAVQLLWALTSYLQIQGRPQSGNAEDLERIERGLWGLRDPEGRDGIGELLKRGVDGIETLVRPHLLKVKGRASFSETKNKGGQRRLVAAALLLGALVLHFSFCGWGMVLPERYGPTEHNKPIIVLSEDPPAVYALYAKEGASYTGAVWMGLLIPLGMVAGAAYVGLEDIRSWMDRIRRWSDRERALRAARLQKRGSRTEDRPDEGEGGPSHE